MTDNRNLNRQILRLALPAMFEMVLNTMVWTVDTAFIGQLSPAALSSVNLGSSMLYAIANIVGAVGIGATALVSRNIGAGDNARATYIGSQIITIGMLVGVLINGLLFLNAERIMGRLAPDPEVVSLGVQYLKIVVFGGAFLIPGFMSNSILRGSGNTILPMAAALIANTINIIGDYVLIFGKFGFPKLGVAGGALATAVAQITGFLIVFLYLCSGKYKVRYSLRKVNLKDLKELKNIFRLGLPAGMESFMNEGSRLLGTFWIAQIGTVSYAAHTVAAAAESLSFMPAYGFSIATGSLVGRFMGAGQVELAERGVKISMNYSRTFMGLLGLVFFFFSMPIARLFSNDASTVALAAACLKIGAFEQVAIAVMDIYSSALKGAGDTRTPFAIAFIANVGVRLPLIFVIVFVLRLEVTYVWYVTVSQYILYALVITVFYKKGKWKKIDII